MIYKKPSIVRSFCSWSKWSKWSKWSQWSNRIGVGIPGAIAALLLLSALSISSHAQILPYQIAVTPLPYLLTNTGKLSTVTVVATTVPLRQPPPEVGQSTFGSLFGGGFNALKGEFPATYGGAATMIQLNKLKIMTDEVNQQKALNQVNQNAQDALNNAKDVTSKATQCAKPNVVQANATVALHASSRIKARRLRNNFPRMAAADTCELSQEEAAEEAEEELEALNESETAVQDSLEAAETAAEAAEVAAEAAESAVEAALEAAEILETILEACSLF